MIEDRSVLTRTAPPADRTLAYGAEPEQIADVRVGAEGSAQHPLLLLLHGGFWRPAIDRAHLGPLASMLARRGWTAASVEYRRVPGEPDRTLEDIARALAVLPEQIAQIAPYDGRTLVLGHSAGGHLALWTAAQATEAVPHGVLALAPAADLQLADALNLGDGAVRAFLGCDPRQRADADPRRSADPHCPTLIVHGEADEIVPLALSESYAAAHARAQLVRLAGTGHFALIDPDSPAFAVVLEALGSLAA